MGMCSTIRKMKIWLWHTLGEEMRDAQALAAIAKGAEASEQQEWVWGTHHSCRSFLGSIIQGLRSRDVVLSVPWHVRKRHNKKPAVAAQPSWASASFLKQPNGNNVPQWPREQSEVPRCGSHGSFAGYRCQGKWFPSIFPWKLRVQAAPWCRPHCSLQQHCQPWDELVHSSHLGKINRFLKNATAAVWFWVVLSPHPTAAAERNRFFMGVKLMVSETGIRWTVSCGGASSKTVSGHQAARQWHTALFQVSCLLFYLPFLVEMVIVPKDTSEDLSSSSFQQASKTIWRCSCEVLSATLERCSTFLEI